MGIDSVNEARPVVLVVDDDHDVQDVAREVLAGHGYDLVIASDGETAVRLIESHRPVVVVLDLNIPAISGPFVAAMAQQANRPPRLIICSGVAGAEQIARDVGADGVLKKPFSRTELRDIVESFI